MTVKDDYATSSSTVKDYVADPRSGLDEESFCELVRKPAAKLAFGWLTLDSYCILGALQPAYPAEQCGVFCFNLLGRKAHDSDRCRN